MSLPTIEAGFRALLLNQEPSWFADVDQGRQRVYRELVRNSLLGTLQRACPNALRLHGDVFAELAGRFLQEAPPTTRLVRDVPGQFTSWLLRQELSTLPAPARSGAFGELCHFEALEIEVTLAETASHSLAPLHADVRLVLDPSARLAIYRHAVHRVTSKTTALPLAASQAQVLLCFQRAEQFVVDLVSPAIGKLLLMVSQGHTLGQALQSLVEEAAVSAVMLDVGRVRADVVDLQHRGAVSVAD